MLELYLALRAQLTRLPNGGAVVGDLGGPIRRDDDGTLVLASSFPISYPLST